MQEFAGLIRDAKTAVLVWSMGITQHVRGGDAVQMILNLGLAKGFVGRDKCGLMPIRGHSSVQGGAEMGAYSTAFPGGKPINAETRPRFPSSYGFEVPDWPGLTAPEMVEACRAGELDLLYCLGGNFLRTLPDPEHVRRRWRMCRSACTRTSFSPIRCLSRRRRKSFCFPPKPVTSRTMAAPKRARSGASCSVRKSRARLAKRGPSGKSCAKSPSRSPGSRAPARLRDGLGHA